MKFPKPRLVLIALLLFSSTHCFADEAKAITPKWSGDAGLDYSYSQSDYVSKTLAASTDLLRQYGQHEAVIDTTLNNQTIQIPGNSDGINRFRYDAIVKWKYLYKDSPWFSFISPRLRRTDGGNFRSAEAIRLGGGRRFSFNEDSVEVTLEAGLGYRHAVLSDQSNIKETLNLFSAKSLWEITPSLSMRFKLTQEQGSLENYRTTTLELRNKVTKSFSIKLQMNETRTLSNNVSTPNAELISSIGFSYEL